MTQLPDNDKAPLFLTNVEAAKNILHEPFPSEKIGAIDVYGTPSVSFIDKMNKTYNDDKILSEPMRQFLSFMNARICAGSFYTDIQPNAGALTPTIDNPRVHANQSPGVYIETEKQVVVTEMMWVMRPPPIPIEPQTDMMHPTPSAPLPIMPLLHNMAEPPPILPEIQYNWAAVIAEDPEHTLIHEIGHSFFRLCPPELLDKETLIKAYHKDLERLGGRDAAREKGLGYFVQDEIPDRGLNETFAESLARSAPDSPNNFWQEMWPNICICAQDFRDNFDKRWNDIRLNMAMEQGQEEAFQQFLDEGSNVNTRNNKGTPLLTQAIKENKTKTALSLLKDPNIDPNALDKHDKSAILIATNLENNEVIDALLERDDIKDIDRACEEAAKAIENYESLGIRRQQPLTGIASKLEKYKIAQQTRRLRVSRGRRGNYTILRKNEATDNVSLGSHAEAPRRDTMSSPKNRPPAKTL